MEKHSPPPFLFSLFFLIDRVCRKFITYRGQGNLHVFLEIFLALDLTAILALEADGGISRPSPFHKTQRHAQECETLSCFSSHFPHCPFLFSVSSGSSGGRQWPRGCLQFTFCAATGTRREVKFHLRRQGREGRQRGQACQKWISVSRCSPLHITKVFPRSFPTLAPQLT